MAHNFKQPNLLQPCEGKELPSNEVIILALFCQASKHTVCLRYGELSSHLARPKAQNCQRPGWGPHDPPEFVSWEDPS
jgi:hypothetical protein